MLWGRSSVVGIATLLGTGRSGFQNLLGAREFLFSIRAGCGAHPASSLIGTGAL